MTVMSANVNFSVTMNVVEGSFQRYAPTFVKESINFIGDSYENNRFILEAGQ